MIRNFLRDNLPLPLLHFSDKTRNCFKWINSAISSHKYNAKYEGRKGKKNLYLIGSPHYHNMGDHAIALSTLEFIKPKELGFDAIYEVYLHQYHDEKFALRKFTTSKDVFLIQGGGYMGDQHMAGEIFLRHVVQDFPKNRLIFLPQTMYYSNTEHGNKQLLRAKKFYKKHPDLHLFAREQITYDSMTQHFPTAKVYKAPDMVVSSNWTDNSKTRNGFVFFMRDDVERVLNQENYDLLTSIANKFEQNITLTDTCEYEGLIPDAQTRELRMNHTLNKFRTARLVVTDRLHGMLLAAVTQTRCIAFSNFNHKVLGVYKWIEDLDYISFMNSNSTPEQIETEMKRLLSIDNCIYDQEKYAHYFDSLSELLKKS